MICEKLRIRISFNLIDASPILFKGVNVKDLWIEDDLMLESLIEEIHNLLASYPDVFAARQTHVSIQYIKKYFENPKQDDLPCVYGYTELCFDPYGNVYPGCWVLSPVGNIRSQESKRNIMFRKIFGKGLFKCLRS